MNRHLKRQRGRHDRWTMEGRAALLREALANAEGPEFDGSRFSPCMVHEPVVISGQRLRLVKNIHVISIALEPIVGFRVRNL